MFENKYRWQIGEKEYYSNAVASGKKTILPFFGFSHSRDTESYTGTYGGNIVVTKQTNDSYKVEKTPSGIYTRHRYYEEFNRTDGLPGEEAAQIETKIEGYLKSKGIPVETSYYIYPSVDEYHSNHGETKGSPALFATALIALIAGIAAGVYIMFVLQDRLLAELHPIFEYLYKYFAAAPIVAGLAIAIFCFIKRAIGNKRLRRTPLSQLGDEYVARVTKRYHGTMYGVYGKEHGALLVRYNELRNKK